MYAIIKTGGKQYRVEKGQFVDVELIPGEANADVEFTDVLLVSDGERTTIGAPSVDKGVVKGRIHETVLGKKIDAVKFKRRKSQRTHWGHRQKRTRVEITDITV